MARKKKKFPAALFFLLIAAAAGIYFYYSHEAQVEKINKAKTSAAVRKKAKDAFFTGALNGHTLVISESDSAVTARMPFDLDEAKLKTVFEDAVSGCKGAAVESAETKEGTGTKTEINILYDGLPVFKAVFLSSGKPRIAIILDDWGYSDRNFHFFPEIKQPFTIAVLPGHSFSRKAADLARNWKKDVILHLPMQPIKKMPMEKSTILAGMSKEQIGAIFASDLESIGGALGANNHEGSLVTADRGIMDNLMEFFAARKMFFVDSVTNGRTVACTSARDHGVASAQRDIFIDNIKELKYVEAQIELLEKAARRKGFAIGIGHDNPVTLEALGKKLPQLEGDGFEIVYVRELVK